MIKKHFKVHVTRYFLHAQKFCAGVCLSTKYDTKM